MPYKDEVKALVQDILRQMPADAQKSPDVTLLVFQEIENKSAKFGSRYRTLGGGKKGNVINAQIGEAVKSLLGRVNDTEVAVSDEQCNLIESYTRFQPIL